MDESFRFSPEQELYNPGDSIVYSCESGYGQVADSNTGRTCLEDGSWSGGEISCECEYDSVVLDYKLLTCWQ